MFTVLAHRGFSSQAPENTLAAFDLALAEGFDNVELDVQLSSDGVPVVIHDESLERTTNGIGLVSEHTLEQLRHLDPGSWFDANYSEEKIPTLAEVVDRYGDRARLHVELKSEQEALPSEVQKLLVGLVNQQSADPFTAPGITITSFYLDQLHRSIELWKPDGPPHHWCVRDLSDSMIETALAAGVKGICLPVAVVTPENVKAVMDAGLTIRAWRLRNMDDLVSVLEAGAQGATFNWPDVARDYIATQKN